MRVLTAVKLEIWMYAALTACFVTGCPDTSAGVDAAGEVVAPADVANDLDDAAVDLALPRDVANDLADVTNDIASDAGMMDANPPRCVPGMSIACACTDGRMGAQICDSDNIYGPCQCTTGTDASTSDVVLPPLGARLIAPQSVSRVTSRRPTMRWVLPDGVTRARVELCADRACTRMLVQQEVTGTSWRPTAMLAPGVTYWRVRGLDTDGGVAWSSATWEFVVGQRDASVDTSFGTLKDFNGDGFDDVAVPDHLLLPQYINVHFGRGAMGSSEPSQRFETTPHYIYAQAVGDFNGDGFADLASASPARNDGIHDYQIQVRYGGHVGLPLEPSLVLSQSSSAWFGQNVGAGDTDGDGFSDLVTVAANSSGTANNVEIFLGGERGLESTPTSTVEAPRDYVQSGFRAEHFEMVGDVNADGYSDLLTSWERGSSDPSLESGRAWLVAGHPSLPLQAWVVLPPPTSRQHFGGAVAGVGDLDGDGIADFAIGSAEEVSVYLGVAGVFSTRPVRTIQSPEAPCYLYQLGFGSSLGRAGDYNGDGHADLAIGAPCLPYAGSFNLGVGSAFLYQGQVGGISSVPTVFRGTASETYFGSGLGGIGDFNGDGYGDLAILQLYNGMHVDAALFVFPGSPTGILMSGIWTLGAGVDGFFPAIASIGLLSQSRGG